MTKPKINKEQRDFPAEYEQGRRARLASISRDEAPYEADSDQLGAWQAGYDDDADPTGARARDETMEPEPTHAGGQMGVVASAKKA